MRLTTALSAPPPIQNYVTSCGEKPVHGRSIRVFNVRNLFSFVSRLKTKRKEESPRARFDVHHPENGWITVGWRQAEACAPFRPVSYDSPLVLIISDAEYGTGDGVLLAVALRAMEYKPARLFLLVNYTHAVKTAITSSIPRCALLAMRKTKGGKRRRGINVPEASFLPFLFHVDLLFLPFAFPSLSRISFSFARKVKVRWPEFDASLEIDAERSSCNWERKKERKKWNLGNGGNTTRGTHAVAAAT